MNGTQLGGRRKIVKVLTWKIRSTIGEASSSGCKLKFSAAVRCTVRPVVAAGTGFTQFRNTVGRFVSQYRTHVSQNHGNLLVRR